MGNATSRLRCAVVNVCDSHRAGDLLDQGLEFVVTYGADLPDDLAHDFAKSFYGSPSSTGIRQCFDTAMRALATAYPEASRLYRLHPEE